jgi:hypothetical protein
MPITAKSVTATPQKLPLMREIVTKFLKVGSGKGFPHNEFQLARNHHRTDLTKFCWSSAAYPWATEEKTWRNYLS